MQSNDSTALQHDEAVRLLNHALSSIDDARDPCRAHLRSYLQAPNPADLVEHAYHAVDTYAVEIERQLHSVLGVRAQCPGAWEASDGGRAEREYRQMMERVILDAMALALGME